MNLQQLMINHWDLRFQVKSATSIQHFESVGIFHGFRSTSKKQERVGNIPSAASGYIWISGPMLREECFSFTPRVSDQKWKKKKSFHKSQKKNSWANSNFEILKFPIWRQSVVLNHRWTICCSNIHAWHITKRPSSVEWTWRRKWEPPCTCLVHVNWVSKTKVRETAGPSFECKRQLKELKILGGKKIIKCVVTRQINWDKF